MSPVLGKWLSGLFVSGFLAFASPCVAQPNSGLRVDGIAAPFNKAAERLGLAVRLALESCKTDKLQACRYAAGTGVGVVSGSMPDRRALRTLSVAAQPDKAEAVLGGLKFLATITVLMAILSPEADRSELDAAAANLLEAVGKKDRLDAEVMFRGVRYQVMMLPGIGAMASIERP
ncbi:hypothetical protein PQJ75_14070 [Rhodoplanes sp. TEM]|uniref:Uncharacterized protein n=1 Tax=Rhodoplanes tepidamans TaxID=200616 RepID=A0ABT5JEB1_RHOTP|nr:MULTISPECIES: hypothetical protein [Rhodoplanes]MDC7788019.1 hypothetical protein [Rhodoplanes tepidamans]MDC7984859.1 hypothetical protein [Rhodoplanes sp. TEM]MDQ0358448.1 hypothetical protein [Rhodoplanes tepidamans]